MVRCRDTRLKNLSALKRILDNNWYDELSDQSPSKNMEKIHVTLSSAIDHCMPYRERVIKYKQIRREPWLTASIKISIDCNKKLYAKMLRHECSAELYKRYNQLLRKTIRQAKIKFYIEICHEYRSKTKKLWGLINEILGKRNDKNGVLEYLTIDGVKDYNAKRICNRFAKYFANVGENFAAKIPAPTKSAHDYLKLLQNSQTSLFLNPTDVKEIVTLISQLPNKSSSGHDNISNILLKKLIHQIAPVLVEVFNKSMTMGEFPTVMKLAEVVPLYKSKENFLETNYRPISLLTTMSKILEKIMYQRIYSFLQNTGQIYENQYGFRANHSCEHAIGQVVGTLIKNIENQLYSACILLDLSKAFDTIEH